MDCGLRAARRRRPASLWRANCGSRAPRALRRGFALHCALLALIPFLAAAVPGERPSPRDQGGSPGDVAVTDGGFGPAIETALTRMVKIYGASIGRQRGYGSGVLVSPDGKVLTTNSLLIDAVNLRVVTADGHIYPARVIYREDYRQLALLKLARHPENMNTDAPVAEQMASMNLPYLIPGGSHRLLPGDWVLAMGNPFKIADGAEPVSVSKGVLSGRARLDARQGTQDFPYRGDVLLIDAITSTVGSAGSAIFDVEENWVGLVGEIVQSRLTHTNLNYAYPAE
jgi:serine protease Do